jgi:rare lipoprotein A
MTIVPFRVSFQLAAAFLLFLQVGCSTAATVPISPTQRPYIISNIKYYPIPSSAGYVDTGIASWYGPGFHGRQTSNGERYDMNSSTAAHKILPMNTMLLVQNIENGRESVVRINDRGPFVRGRIIDLSYSTAKNLGILQNGTAKVKITALAPSDNGKNIHPPNFNEGEFYVQIGSFTKKNNAQRLQQRFTDAGHKAVIQEYETENSTFFRVQIYTGTQLQTAGRAEEALLAKGYKGAFIVAR